MYKAGQIKPDVELFAMDDALEAYRKLEAGELSGRAVVIPIFEIAESADAAFNAITSAWVDGGYCRSDRASVRDFYSADKSPSEGAGSKNAAPGFLQQLSIRGRADGISMTLSSVCVIAR